MLSKLDYSMRRNLRKGNASDCRTNFLYSSFLLYTPCGWFRGQSMKQPLQYSVSVSLSLRDFCCILFVSFFLSVCNWVWLSVCVCGGLSKCLLVIMNICLFECMWCIQRVSVVVCRIVTLAVWFLYLSVSDSLWVFCENLHFTVQLWDLSKWRRKIIDCI